MSTLQAGQKVLSSVVSTLTVIPGLKEGLVCDIGAFCLSNGKLFGDEYFVFYNNPSTPDGSIKLEERCGSIFSLDLSKLNTAIDKIVVTMVADSSLIKQFEPTTVVFKSSDNEYQYATEQSLYIEHTAIMLFEFYKHNGVWKMNANGQGFNGGLAALIKHFGGEVEEADPVVVEPPKPKGISLEKVFEKEKPRLVNLAKQAETVILAKGLDEVKARVIIVLDASGSMCDQYSHGDVQRTVERIVPLAVKFDSDRTLECYAFASSCKKLKDITLSNVDDYLKNQGLKLYGGDIGIGCSNNESCVIEKIIKDVKGSKEPIFVVFIGDGGIGSSESREIEALLRKSCSLPIFWQFVGIGGSSYGVLQRLDDMTGRSIDNTNFFAISKLDELSETDLYDKLLNEFPGWLKEAKKQRLF